MSTDQRIVLDHHDAADRPPQRSRQTGRRLGGQERRRGARQPPLRTGNERGGVEVIDMYTPLAAKLELAAGDEHHWSGPAYKMISEAIVAKTNEALKPKSASK